MYYYAIEHEIVKEDSEPIVRYFESDMDLRNGGSFYPRGKYGGDFIIVGYSTHRIYQIDTPIRIVDFGVINDPEAVCSAQQWADKEWVLVEPIKVGTGHELRLLVEKLQDAPLMEYIGPAPRFIYIDIDNGELPF